MVTIIIPAYNAETTIQWCLESVIQQDVAKEIILADDGSTDRTVEFAKEYIEQIRILSLSHSGVSTTRNAGLAAAEGDWVMFLDADDALLPDVLAKMEPQMTEDVDAICGMICRGNETFKTNGKTVKFAGGHNLLDFVLANPTDYLTIHAWVFRRKPEMPCFDPGLRIGEDSDWVLRYLYTARQTVFISIPVYRYTVSDDSAVHGWREGKDRDFLAMLKKLSRSIAAKENNWSLFVLINYLLVLTHVIFHPANPAKLRSQFRVGKKLRSEPMVDNAFKRADLTKLNRSKRIVLTWLKQGWMGLAYLAVKFRQMQNKKRVGDCTSK